MYDHSAAFSETGYVDWMQFGNYEVGDIVYIYASKQEGKIKYKTIVTKTDMSFSEIKRNDDFWKDTHDLKREKMKYSRLKLVKRIEGNRLNLALLRQHGLKNAPQRSKKIDGELLAYIESFE